MVGGLNTAVHWAFFFMAMAAGLGQAPSNVFAFSIAVTVSYFMNARFTFKARKSVTSFALFSVFLGVVAFSIGKLSDVLNLLPLFTLIAFSSISLVLGFIYSKYVVFGDAK